MSDFAKIFATPHGQLLVFVDELDDGAPCLTIIGERCNGVRPLAQMSGWPDPDGAEHAFAKVSQEEADRTASDLRAAAGEA